LLKEGLNKTASKLKRSQSVSKFIKPNNNVEVPLHTFSDEISFLNVGNGSMTIIGRIQKDGSTFHSVLSKLKRNHGINMVVTCQGHSEKPEQVFESCRRLKIQWHNIP
jgi:tRNA(His) 5'-end guanylyltransferase